MREVIKLDGEFRHQRLDLANNKVKVRPGGIRPLLPRNPRWPLIDDIAQLDVSEDAIPEVLTDLAEHPIGSPFPWRQQGLSVKRGR